MTPDLALLVAMLWPLGVAAVVVVLGRWPDLRDTAMVALAVVPALLLGLLVLPAEGAAVQLGHLVPGVGLSFRSTELGLVYALVAACLWPVTALYAVGYMRGHHEHHQTRFFAFFSASISAALALAFADNLLVMFLAYEALTVSTFPLVTHHQDEAAQGAGRIYAGILLSTSVGLMLPAILWTWSATGQVAFEPGGFLAGKVVGWHLPVLLGLYAFGAGKAALMPLHGWLPAAMVAPTPVSALLHAVAVVKAGVFVILRVAHDVFGAELLTSTGAARWLGYVACFTLVAASVIALSRTNLKERLAYSTIGQLAYIVLGATLGLAGIEAGAFHIAAHALGKITLFFVAGAVMVTAHKTEIPDLDGLGRRMPWTFAAFGLAAMGVTGIPPFLGGLSKLALLSAAAGQGAWVALVALSVSTLLNVVYLGEIVGRAFFLPPHHDPHHPEAPHGDADLRMRVPLLVTAGASLLLGVFLLVTEAA